VKKPGFLVTAPLKTAISPLLAATSSILHRRRPGVTRDALTAPRPDSFGYDTILGYDTALGYDTVLGYDLTQRAPVPAVLSRSGRIPRDGRRVHAHVDPTGSAPGPGARPAPGPQRQHDPPPRPTGVRSANSLPTLPPAGHEETSGQLRRMGALDPGDGLRAALREAVTRDQMRHVWYITALYSSQGSPGEDEVTLAYRTLGIAVDGFDPEGGESFLHYAVPVILREVKASRRRNGNGDLASAHRTRQIAAALRASAEQLTKQLGRSPSVPELAEATGESCEQIVESLDAALGHTKPWTDLPEPTPHDATESDHTSARLRTASGRAALTVAFTALEHRAKRTLLMRFLRKMSQEQIATELGVPQEQVSRLQARSMNQLGMTRTNPFSALAHEPDTPPAPAGRPEMTAQPALLAPTLLAA
jgi:RNA polymerase sigma-B factor